GVVEHGIRQKLLQSRIFNFQRLQTLGLGHLHAAVLRLPAVECLLANAVPAAHRNRRLRTGLGLLQDANDLFFGKSAAFHLSSPPSTVYGKLTLSVDRKPERRSVQPAGGRGGGRTRPFD